MEIRRTLEGSTWHVPEDDQDETFGSENSENPIQSGDLGTSREIDRGVW